jgi:hypothetical protein
MSERAEQLAAAGVVVVTPPALSAPAASPRRVQPWTVLYDGAAHPIGWGHVTLVEPIPGAAIVYVDDGGATVATRPSGQRWATVITGGNGFPSNAGAILGSYIAAASGEVLHVVEVLG